MIYQGVYTQYTQIKSKLISLISAQSQGGTRWDQYHWMWMLVDPSFHIGDSVWICALHMGQVFSRSNHMETQFSQNMCWKEKKKKIFYIFWQLLYTCNTCINYLESHLNGAYKKTEEIHKETTCAYTCTFIWTILYY